MTAKIIKLILVIVLVASLTGCLMGKNEKPVLFCCSGEEVPAEDCDVMYEKYELPESGLIILFPKKPVEERGEKLSDVSGH